MSHQNPPLVEKLCHFHEAWIVGSAADPTNTDPRDYDVLVPLSKWQDAAGLIPSNATINTFGGFKCIEEGIEIDVWPGELSWLMSRPKTQWIWSPKTGARWKRIKGLDKE